MPSRPTASDAAAQAVLSVRLALVTDRMEAPEALAAALRLRGITVTPLSWAQASPRALAAALTADAVLVDLSLATSPGWLAGLRRSNAEIHPVVACASDDVDDALALLDGTGEVVRKPLHAGEVAARLARLAHMAARSDPAEARRSRAALEQSEANLAEAQRIAHLGSWQHDLQRDEVVWSAHYYALLGLPPDAEPNYRTVLDLVHPADRDDFGAHFLAAMRESDGGSREYRIVRPDGEVRTMRTTFRIDRDAAGAAIRVAGTTQDVTARRVAEAALEESEARLRQASALASLGNWVWDAVSDRCKYCSPEHARLHGMTPQAYIESAATLQQSFSMVHEDDRERVTSLYVALRRGEPFDAQYRIVTPEGAVRHVREIAMPVFDDDGRVVEEYGVAHDITRLLQTERALAESEARFRAVIDQAPLAFALTDRDGRLQSINRTFRAWYRGELPEPVGRSWAEVLAPALARRLEEVDAAALADGRVHQVELPMTSPERAQYILVSAFPLRDADGEIYGIGHIGIDLTTQRLAEERLRQAQKMEVVGQMTGGVAHDFNNLLTAVIGNLDLLSERLAHDRGARKLVETASRAAERGGRLTQQLLAFSRKQVLDPEATDVNDVVRQFLPLARASVRANIDLETRLARNLKPVLVDRGQLEAALLNLVINARDAIAEDGRVVVTTADRAPGSNLVGPREDIAAGDYVMIAVADSGAGMSASTRDQAVDPFFTTKPVGQGSGLGLSMVFGFVKQSGGQLAIDSAPGRGTSVRLFLPVVPAAETDAASSPAPTPGTAPGGREQILVVEDDPDVRRFVATVLSGLGYRVLQAHDGGAAARLMASHPAIDLLLTDMMLPGEAGGHDVAARFRAQFPHGKVLYTSGRAIELAADETGDAPLLHKPYRVDTLAARVRAVLDA